MVSAGEALSRTDTTPPTAFYTLDGYAGMAEAFLAAWESASEAQQATVLRLRSDAGRACRALRRFAKVMPIAEPWALLCQGLHDWLDGRGARAYRAWQGALDGASRLGMPLAEGLAHFEIGRHLDAGSGNRRAHLERAGAIFERLGAPLHLAAAREPQANPG